MRQHPKYVCWWYWEYMRLLTISTHVMRHGVKNDETRASKILRIQNTPFYTSLCSYKHTFVRSSVSMFVDVWNGHVTVSWRCQSVCTVVCKTRFKTKYATRFRKWTKCVERSEQTTLSFELVFLRFFVGYG